MSTDSPPDGPDDAPPEASGDGADGRRHSVTLDVYSDYTCPWCYVGWARLEKALATVGGEVDVDVTWHPFEIHPGVPPEGMPVSELGYPPERWEQMQEALAASAAAEGLEVGNRPKVSNTHRALVASVYAQTEEPERFPAFHEALFVGYFAEGRDLGDPAVVRTLAERAGLDVAAMEAALEEGRYETALSATTARTRALGITGTPTFVFDEKFAAVGAQPAEVLVQAFNTLTAPR